MDKKHIIILFLFLEFSFSLNCYCQSVPFSIGDTATFEIKYKKAYRNRDWINISNINSISYVGLHSIDKVDSSFTFFLICKEYKNSATDLEIGLEKAIVGTIINFPILFSIKKSGLIIIKNDTVLCKEKYIDKFKSIANSLNLNNENDGLENYISSLKNTNFSEIVQRPIQPEIELLSKVIAHTQLKAPFEINDKEDFRDFGLSYSDSLKISRKTSFRINKINRRETELVYRKNVSEDEIKKYMLNRYPKIWAKLKISYPEIDLESREKQLKLFKPIYREIIRTTTVDNGRKLKSIKYYYEENVMLEGGVSVECFISILNN